MESTASISSPASGRKLIAPVWHTVPNVVPLYLSVIAVEWILVCGVWAGIRIRGVHLRDLIGGRWKSAKDVLIDFALAIVVWILWIGIQVGVGRMVLSDAKSVSVLFPQDFLEIILWIATSLTAGFCEEVAFRGYFQKQFEAMTGSAAAGVFLQGILFGISHGYQGLRAISMIILFGFLYGILAFWRKSLRPGMVLHAWSDIYAGYLFQFMRL